MLKIYVLFTLTKNLQSLIAKIKDDYCPGSKKSKFDKTLISYSPFKGSYKSKEILLLPLWRAKEQQLYYIESNQEKKHRTFWFRAVTLKEAIEN